ncbi:hypothetical protein [Phaeobacter sp. JH20_26]|uniref:hypothetical protein n=1 Tax=Phaeobacter sp. JH20_26 TaxID=3112483 RepID=UPI003A88EA20
MIIIKPIEVTGQNLTSDVALSEPEWSAGTTPQDAIRRVGNILYRAVVETTDSPIDGLSADPPTWIKVGAANRFKMFDEFYHSQTEADEVVTVTIDPPQVVNSVTLLNVDAVSVTIEIFDDHGALIYQATKSMADNSQVADYWDYFFSPVLRKKNVSFVDLPSYSRPIKITVAGEPGGTVQVGGAFIGAQRKIGLTQYGTDRELMNFSDINRDQFGIVNIVPRRKADLASFQIDLDTPQNDFVYDLLRSLADIPCIYIGDPNRDGTIVYGYPRGVRIPYETPDYSKITLEVESVT